MLTVCCKLLYRNNNKSPTAKMPLSNKIHTYFAFAIILVISRPSTCLLVSLRTRGSPDVSTGPQEGMVGDDQLEYPINNIGYGGIGQTRPVNNIPPEEDFEGSAALDEENPNAHLLHPNTDLKTAMCPRVENKMKPAAGEICPRGWLDGPACETPDLRDFGKCEWEVEAELEMPHKLAKFRGVLCRGRRIYCLKDAGVMPGNTELVYAPKNYLSDEAELAETLSNLKQLAAVDFSRNDFYFLSSKTFIENICLRSVSFNLNYLLDIPEMIFSKNRMLTSASFVGNKLDYLPPRLFYYNHRLTIVDFERNNITLIPPEVFRNNRRLEIVRLTGNAIPDIPAGLFSANPLLREVGLSHNRISVVPKSLFDNSRKLENLFLGGNRLKNLPDNLFDNCQELRTLNLENNLISSLPARLFERNQKLAHVDISFNRFHVVNPELFVNNPVVTITNQQWAKRQGIFEDEQNEDGTWGISHGRQPNIVRKFGLGK